MLLGSGFESGSHQNCWLGGGRSNATAYEGGSRLRCVAPAALGTQAYQTQVSVSLNAQQVSDAAPFVFYPTPSLQELMPDSGDAGSRGTGTLVRVLTSVSAAGSNTSGFANGTDARCRFGGTAGATGGPLLAPDYLPLLLSDGTVGSAPASVRPATVVSAGELRCTAPHSPSTGSVSFRVSLNGQQYGPALNFDLLPPPRISGIETGFR